MNYDARWTTHQILMFYSVCTVHTANIKLPVSNTDCVKTCLTALMEYSANTERHSDSKIMNLLKFLRLTCSHSIRSPTVTLCANDSLAFPLFGTAHFDPPCLPPLWCCKFTCRHSYRTTTVAPGWRIATFPYRGPWPSQCSVSWQKRWKCVGPIAWFLWDLGSDASWKK